MSFQNVHCCDHITMYMYCKCTHHNTITMTDILETCSCDRTKYDQNPVVISSKAFCNGQTVVEYHRGIPIQVPCYGLPQWYFTMGESQIVRPVLHRTTTYLICLQDINMCKNQNKEIDLKAAPLNSTSGNSTNVLNLTISS